MIRVAIVGHKLAAELIAEYLLRRAGTKVTAVITQANSWQGDMKAWAEGNGIRCYVGNPNHYADELMIDRPDHILCLQCRTKLGSLLCAVPKAMNPINMHYSLLPRHAGCDTLNNVISSGDTETGVTWHLMTAEYDAGDILYQARTRMVPNETFHALHMEMTNLAEEHFPRFWDALMAGAIKPRRQDLKLRTYHRRTA